MSSLVQHWAMSMLLFCHTCSYPRSADAYLTERSRQPSVKTFHGIVLSLEFWGFRTMRDQFLLYLDNPAVLFKMTRTLLVSLDMSLRMQKSTSIWHPSIYLGFIVCFWNVINSHPGLSESHWSVALTRRKSPNSESAMISLCWIGKKKLGGIYFINRRRCHLKTKMEQNMSGEGRISHRQSLLFQKQFSSTRSLDGGESWAAWWESPHGRGPRRDAKVSHEGAVSYLVFQGKKHVRNLP